MLAVRRLCQDAILPRQGTDEAAGYDLCWTGVVFRGSGPTLEPISVSSLSIAPNTAVRLGTGWKISIPRGYHIDLRERSSLASQCILVGGGLMDSDYRGEYIVILINVGTTPKTINKGDKISQMVLCRHESPTLVEDNEEKSATAAVQPVFSIPDAASSPSALVQARAFDTTARGTGGFGSTGT